MSLFLFLTRPDAGLLKIKEISELGNEGPLPHLSGVASPLVVDQKEIAQRLVNKIEADVAGNLLQGAVVLDQCVEEQIR